MFAAFLWGALNTLSSSKANAADVTPLEVGAAAPDFNLPGVDDKPHSLADFADAKILVVVFTCNHCPTAQAYEDRLIQLYRDYHDRGVALVAISPNDPLAVNLSELGYTELGDSFEEMKIRAEDKHFPFPYLYDGETQATSRAFGVLATPHVYIFDEARTLRYVGRVDDGEVKPPTSHDARNAIDALLAGEEVSTPRTRVFGCSTKWSDKRELGQTLMERWQAEEVTLTDIDVDGVRELAAGEGTKYRLINVWATWCAPCVDELPEFVDMNRMYRRRPFEMITISYDEPDDRDAALKMLAESYASTRNYFFTGENRDALAEALDPEWEGPVPYTMLVAPDGEVLYRHHGVIDPLEVRRTIVERLGRTYAADRREE